MMGQRQRFQRLGILGSCDERANIVALILNTQENIAGGFSEFAFHTEDADNLRSFLLILKNAQSSAAQKSAMEKELKPKAIKCDFGCGKVFGGVDIAEFDNCNISIDRFAELAGF
jgi:hypothetical protein